MEAPVPAAASNQGRKRKRILSAARREAKRFRPESVGGVEGQCGRPSSGRSSVSVPPDRLQQPVSVTELTELLHYAALGKAGGVAQPSWCRLRRQRRVSGLSVTIVEGLTQSHFYQHFLRLRRLRTHHSTRVTFTPPPHDIASQIFRSPVPDAAVPRAPSLESRLQDVVDTHPVVTAFGKQRRGLTAYLLSQEDRIRKHFPVKGRPGFEDFVSTDSSDSVTDCSPLFGLDCEMCLTVEGHELSRVSLVDSGGTCLLDQLVKPPNKIIDYLTRFSGITAAMLEPVRTVLRDVQTKLRTLLPSDAVLVGHSLDHDLRALKIVHPHVIDTSLLYRREHGLKFKLKVLAHTVLRRQIQTEQQKGHDPVEDALAALELAQFFITTGPVQVVRLHLHSLWGFPAEESADRPPDSALSLRFSDVLQARGRTVGYFGRRSEVDLDLSRQQWHRSGKELLASFRRQTPRPFLSVLHFPPVWTRPQSQGLSGCVPGAPDRRPTLQGPGHLRDACVVLAGPFPAGSAHCHLKRLFRCCGPLDRIQSINAVQVRVEFQLLEGAELAVRTLDGLPVSGRDIQVRRPVRESTLDLDETLKALAEDASNSRWLYAVRLSRRQDALLRGPNAVRPGGGATDGLSAATPDCGHFRLTEDGVRRTFSRFGAVEDVVLARPGGRSRHAYIRFRSEEGKRAALGAAEGLRTENYLVCPSLTPRHLPSWVAMATSPGEDEEDEDLVPLDKLDKLDHRLGKVFRSLPEGTLSVVLLLGPDRNLLRPGLCLMAVKQTEPLDQT